MAGDPGTDTSSILDWCKHQTVLISGGSGFLGKATLFKLLLSGVPRIYVLIRPKRGQDIEERLDSIVNHEIFEAVRARDPNVRQKLIGIRSDVTEVGLGLSDEDRALLHDQVTVVIHSAASVKFDDSLRKAVHHNLRSARDMVELAKGMKKLKIFHHVSTAYTNCDHMMSSKGVEEKLYERKVDWKKLIEFVDSADDELIAALEPKIVSASVNTYIFTKHLAEAVIEDAAQFIPVVITRPPVVLSAWKEPVPGWMDNVSSPVAIIGGTGKGVLRLHVGTSDAAKAYIPVDIVVNCTVVATWHEAITYNETSTKKPVVYNMENCPITTGKLKELCFELLHTHPTYNAIWHTHFYTVNNRHLFLLGHLLVHFIPGLIFDAILVASGMKPRLTRIYRKLYIALNMLLPVLNTEDKFQVGNYNSLKDLIPEKEKHLFGLDVPTDKDTMSKYLQVSARGFRKLLGDPPEPTEKDFIHQKRLLWVDRGLRAIFVLFFLWVFPFQIFFAPFIYAYECLSNFIDLI